MVAQNYANLLRRRRSRTWSRSTPRTSARPAHKLLKITSTPNMPIKSVKNFEFLNFAPVANLSSIKVIQKIGLCICLYDLLSSSEGLIGHGTGIVNVNGMALFNCLFREDSNIVLVQFRLIVFRPFKHEVMLGKINSSSPTGIKRELLLWPTSPSIALLSLCFPGSRLCTYLLDFISRIAFSSFLP
jgi:hypothetical protein